MLISLFCALLLPAADAGVFDQKTMHGQWAESQVQRELVMPKGWFELGLAVDTKASGAVRGTFGIAEPYDDATFVHSKLWLELSQGFSDRMTLYLRVPFVESFLRNGRGADISTLALGDAHTGIRYQPWLGTNPALAFRVDLKSPSGVEWPANGTGGAAFTEGFLTGTGITNLGGHAEGRCRLGERAAIDASVGYTYKFAGVVGYVVQSGGFGNGWLKPGNEVNGALSGTVQVADPVAISLSGSVAYRTLYFYGVSGEGTGRLSTSWLGAEVEYTYAGGEVETIETDPSGLFADAGLWLSFAPADTWEFGAGASYNLAGSDGRFFSHLGLEEFSPHPGLTLGFSGVRRW